MPLPEKFELPAIHSRPKRHLPPPGKGRLKGSVNRVSKDLKQGLIDAAASLGEDGNGTNGLPGYLRYVGRNHPKAFCHLLGKMIPLQVAADINQTTIGEIRIVSIPAGSYLSQEGADRLAAPGLQLEHDPQPENGALEHAGDVEIDLVSQASPSDPRDPGAHRNGCEGQPDEAETIADLKRQINELARKASLPIAV